LRIPKDCITDEMKKVRNFLVALTMSFFLSRCVPESGASSCRQRKRRTHAPRHFEELETESSELNSVNETLLDDEHGHDIHHSAKVVKFAINCDADSPTVTFGLNRNGVSGGFGDRIRGMVTTYYLAMMMNSSFELDWTQPYFLNDYFLVPSCDERVGSKDDDAADRSHYDHNHGIDHKIIRTSIDVWNYFTDSLFLNDTGKNLEIITNSFHWKEIVQNQAFEDRAALLGFSGLSQAELFKVAIDDLLGKPTKIRRWCCLRLAGPFAPFDRRRGMFCKGSGAPLSPHAHPQHIRDSRQRRGHARVRGRGFERICSRRRFFTTSSDRRSSSRCHRTHRPEQRRRGPRQGRLAQVYPGLVGAEARVGPRRVSERVWGDCCNGFRCLSIITADALSCLYCLFDGTGKQQQV